MHDYQHILVATDLHNDALPVVREAISLAQKYGAKLSLISVVPSVPYYLASGVSSISDIEDQLENETRKRLDKIKQDLGIEADFYLQHGSAKLEIVRLAEKLGVDLIVIGSHGHRGVQRLLGSTSSGVLHLAHCNVLVVRSKT